MLGKAAAAKNGTDKLTFHTRKADAIFYYLIITATPVERIEVAELFWPEMTLANAQKNLRTVLPDLRNMLGDYLIVNNQQIAFNKACPHSVDSINCSSCWQIHHGPRKKKYAQYMACYQGELLAGLAVSNSINFEKLARPPTPIASAEDHHCTA